MMFCLKLQIKEANRNNVPDRYPLGGGAEPLGGGAEPLGCGIEATSTRFKATNRASLIPTMIADSVK